VCGQKYYTIIRKHTKLTTSDQCLHADSKIAEYLHSIPQINFLNQEEKNEYSAHLCTIQEEVRSKFNLFKTNELRQETEKFQNLINSWGLPDSARPPLFQQQSRRKNSTPIKTPTAKKQRTTTDATECQNRFETLAIEESVEEIEIDDPTDEVVTPAPAKKTYAPPITIDNVINSAALLKKLKELTGIKLVAKLIGTSLRIYPQTPAAYHLIRRHATTNNMQHFTYQLPEDRAIRVVIRGIPADMPPEEIMEELIELGFQPQTCHAM
ncbi:hypothetical protein NPIL_124211, partial [Nephila pilipes]